MSLAPLVRLGEVAEFIRGVTYKPVDVTTADDPEGIPCLRTKNIQEVLKDEDLIFIPRRPIKASKIVAEGDILVSSANSWNLVGKCSWIPSLSYEATFGGFTSVLRGDQSAIYRRYLYHWFSSPKIQQLARSFGKQTTSISNLNQARCLDLEIPLPPLDEQKRIAAILDKADQLRQKRRQAIALLDSLTQSIFLEMFGEVASLAWPTATIGEIALDMRTGPFGSQLLHSEFVDEGIAVLGIDNAVNNHFEWGKARFITETKYRALSRYTVKPSDVLITIMGTCGRCAVVPADIPKAINTKHLCCITLNQKKALPEYLHACFLNNRNVLRQLGVQAKGAVMPGLNMGIIKSLVIPIPPISLQQRFQEVLALVQGQIERAKSASGRSAVLLASLQHRAFSGQL